VLLTFLFNIRCGLLAFEVDDILDDFNKDDFDINLKLSIKGLIVRLSKIGIYSAIAVHAPFGIITFSFVKKFGFSDNVGSDYNRFGCLSIHDSAASGKDFMIRYRESKHRSRPSEKNGEKVENLHGCVNTRLADVAREV
jgi:hypothetical protein